jgi:hypothetical protein
MAFSVGNESEDESESASANENASESESGWNCCCCFGSCFFGVFFAFVEVVWMEVCFAEDPPFSQILPSRL